MSSATIEVLGDSEEVLADIFGPGFAGKGSIARGLNGQATLQLVEYEESRGFGFEYALQIVLDFGRDVAVDMVAAWLLERLSHSTKFVKFDGRTYQIGLPDLTTLATRVRDRLVDHHDRSKSPRP
jgi:hypothetical protein